MRGWVTWPARRGAGSPTHRYEQTTTLESGNWKSTADGYLDGYHVSYLHRANIGQRTMSGRNTYDLYGPTSGSASPTIRSRRWRISRSRSGIWWRR
ncbi:MAG: SRPBCC family protein [Ilumatobacteraceae bacterium]